MAIPAALRWTLGIGIATLLVAVPTLYYRNSYAHGKRLREVTPCRVYRSGQMTAEGFEEAIERYHIRTVINLQDEYPDPDVNLRYLSGRTIKETELCDRLGIKYCYLPPDLISPQKIPQEQPKAIAKFLEIMDKESTYPVLLHCKAGLHRTGIMVAVYRMEYEGWTAARAIHEVKANGFGDFKCTAANEYISQYILNYRPRARKVEGP